LKRSLSSIVLIGIIILAVSFSTGEVVAISSSDVTINASLSNPTPKPGNEVTVTVTFQSHVSQRLQILRYGVHADWMASADDFQGPNLSAPATVEANGQYSGSFLIVIPTTASNGSHTYYVGVDGVDAAGNAFSLNSVEATVQVLSNVSTLTPPTTPPTPPSTPNNQPTNSPSANPNKTPEAPEVTPIALLCILIATTTILLFLRKTTQSDKKIAKITDNQAKESAPK
jgi:hypothetical protein